MRLYLALFGFSLIVTIAVCESMLRLVEEARKRRLEASTYRNGSEPMKGCGCEGGICPHEFMFVEARN